VFSTAGTDNITSESEPDVSSYLSLFKCMKTENFPAIRLRCEAMGYPSDGCRA